MTATMVAALQRSIPDGTSSGRQARQKAGEALWSKATTVDPAALVECRGVADVQAAVRVARDHGVSVSVLGGGHDWAGRAVCPGGVVLDLRRLAPAELERDRMTITVPGGALMGDVMARLPDDLAIVGGTYSTVGAGGIALGGGYGKLNSRFGLVADNMIRAEVVLADGSLAVAGDGEDAELFWALRGGGGSFGVVTAMTFTVHHLPEVLTGGIFIPLASTKPALLAMGEMFDTAGDELSILSTLTTMPEAGRGLVMEPLWTGDRNAGEHHLGSLAKLEGAKVINRRGCPYKECYNSMLENPAAPPKDYGYRLDALNITRFDDASADILVEAARGFPSDGFSIVLHDLHGAAARVAPDATAFALRREHVNVQLAAGWNVAAGESDDEAGGWLRRNRAALSPVSLGSGYPNVLGPDQPDSVRAFYGDAAPRLMRAKQRYDPRDVIRSGNGRL